MKKALRYMNNQKGFSLPFTLFFITIIFLVFFAMIEDYKKDIVLTKQHLEQLHIETIIQMAKQEINEKLKENRKIKDKMLTFPTGTARVLLKTSNENGYVYEITATTLDQATYSTISLIKHE